MPSKNPTENTWRKRQIILDPDLVERLYSWHGGQGSSVYSLASTGHEDLVSLSMIDAALSELERDLPRIKNRADKKHLSQTIGHLDSVRHFWREHSAKEAGMGLDESEYKCDRRDYGMSPEEEAEIQTRSG